MNAAAAMNSGVKCAGDPTKLVGQEWLCDDGCHTCSCGADGAVVAYGCHTAAAAASDASTEEYVVQAALMVVLSLFACFAVVCCCMCQQRGSKSTRLRKDEEMDDMDEQ